MIPAGFLYYYSFIWLCILLCIIYLLLINQEVVKWEFVHPPWVWHQVKPSTVADFHVALFVSGSWYWAGSGPPVAGHSNRTEPFVCLVFFFMSLVSPGLLLLWHIKLPAIGPLPVGLRAVNQLSSPPQLFTQNPGSLVSWPIHWQTHLWWRVLSIHQQWYQISCGRSSMHHSW